MRVRYLGRKSPLKLALREVRDRESGMALNAVRERVEAGPGEPDRPSCRRPTRTRRFDSTLPAPSSRAGQYHLITQLRRQIEDVFIGIGYEIFDGWRWTPSRTTSTR